MCSSKYTNGFYSGYFVDPSGNIRPGSTNVFCYTSSMGNAGSFQFSFTPTCEIGLDPASIKIPTVADGIALGWQAGAALILVGCILFLKKALK